MHNATVDNSCKRTKKPKPLFGLFKKNKDQHSLLPTQQVILPTSLLGSGIATTTSVPLVSSVQHHYPKDPYSPSPLPAKKAIPTTRTRGRSKSLGQKDISNSNSATSRLLEERELALTKLCGNPPSESLTESLPLLSPTYNKNHTAAIPAVPPIPLKHKHQQHQIQKFSSAHNLQEVIKNQPYVAPPPLPLMNNRSTNELKRSKSLTNTKMKSPTIPKWPLFPISTTSSNSNSIKWNINNNNDDDDDIPLGYLQSPIKSNSSLLSDQDEDDDKDLIPIATVFDSNRFQPANSRTAADKYKEKVKERLQLEDDKDDDDIPISISLMNKSNKIKIF